MRVTVSTSRHPERDCLVLWLGLTAGMRVTEIAQIEVQEVLFPSGALRSEISLRAAITKGCRQRCIYLGHAKAIEAIDRYLDLRIAGRLRTTADSGRYRGLEPASKLILTRKGYKFHLNTKRRVNWAGETVDYLAYVAGRHTAGGAQWHQDSFSRVSRSRPSSCFSDTPNWTMFVRTCRYRKKGLK